MNWTTTQNGNEYKFRLTCIGQYGDLVFPILPRITNWSFPSIFVLLSASEYNVQQDSRFVDICKTRVQSTQSTQIHCMFKKLNLEFHNLGSNIWITVKIFHQLCEANSVQTPKVFVHLLSAVLFLRIAMPFSQLYKRPLVNNRMERRCQRCQKLVNASRAFCTCEGASSNARPLGEIQQTQVFESIYLPNFSSTRTRFNFKPVQFCNNILRFRRAKFTPHIHVLSFRRLREICKFF